MAMQGRKMNKLTIRRAIAIDICIQCHVYPAAPAWLFMHARICMALAIDHDQLHHKRPAFRWDGLASQTSVLPDPFPPLPNYKMAEWVWVRDYVSPGSYNKSCDQSMTREMEFNAVRRG